MPWRASCPGNIQSLGDGSGPLGSILGRKTEDEVYADVVEIVRSTNANLGMTAYGKAYLFKTEQLEEM